MFLASLDNLPMENLIGGKMEAIASAMDELIYEVHQIDPTEDVSWMDDMSRKLKEVAKPLSKTSMERAEDYAQTLRSWTVTVRHIDSQAD